MDDTIKKKIEEDIKSLLGDYKKCPSLLLEEYVPVFKRLYLGHIYRIGKLEWLREVLERVEGKTYNGNGFLVLDGIGYLSDVGQNSLLKFIEESKHPIILLSDLDKISPIIRSRVKTVYKYREGVKNMLFASPNIALKTIEDRKEDATFDEIKFLGENSPALYALRESSSDPFDPMNKRIFRLLTEG